MMFYGYKLAQVLFVLLILASILYFSLQNYINMKKNVLFLFILLSFAMSSFAQTSNLVVFSEDLNPFYLVVNGIKQNTTPQTNVKVTDIKTQDNAVMVIFKDASLGTVKQDFYFHDMGVEVTAKISKTSKGFKLRHFGEVSLEEATPSTNQFTTSYQNSESSTETNENEVEEPVKITPKPTEELTTTTFTASPKVTSTSPKNTSTATASNGALQMSYKWVAGSKHMFVANQIDDVTTSVMGMNMKDQFKSTTKFLLHINTVDTKGNASGNLFLIDYKVVDSKGRILATLANVPSTAIKSEFKVDNKGNFTFTKKITLVTSLQGNALVYANTSDNSISLGGQVDNVKVDVYAEFDSKTGSLKAGYSIKDTQPVKQITLKVDENTDVVDVLPYDYLNMLVLPDGSVHQGDKFQSNVGIYTIDIIAKNVNANVAQLNYKMNSDKSKNMFGSSATMQSESTTLSTGMPNMSQMMDEMSDDDKKDVDLAKGMMPSMNMDFDSFFDVKTGMFSAVKGYLNTSYNAMGFKVEVVSNLDMKKF